MITVNNNFISRILPPIIPLLPVALSLSLPSIHRRLAGVRRQPERSPAKSEPPSPTTRGLGVGWGGTPQRRWSSFLCSASNGELVRPTTRETSANNRQGRTKQSTAAVAVVPVRRRHLTATTTSSSERHAAEEVVLGSSAATTLSWEQHATATVETRKQGRKSGNREGNDAIRSWKLKGVKKSSDDAVLAGS
nr:hypothetical protein Iba_chr11aCG12710 [Ipomoea batatas]